RERGKLALDQKPITWTIHALGESFYCMIGAALLERCTRTLYIIVFFTTSSVSQSQLMNNALHKVRFCVSITLDNLGLSAILINNHNYTLAWTIHNPSCPDNTAIVRVREQENMIKHLVRVTMHGTWCFLKSNYFTTIFTI
ncbi:hypothetical protein ACJX0J_015897, partial [Zea mays]